MAEAKTTVNDAKMSNDFVCVMQGYAQSLVCYVIWITRVFFYLLELFQ